MRVCVLIVTVVQNLLAFFHGGRCRARSERFFFFCESTSFFRRNSPRSEISFFDFQFHTYIILYNYSHGRPMHGQYYDVRVGVSNRVMPDAMRSWVGVVAGCARRRVPRASVLVEAVVDMLEREQQTFGQLLARAVVGQVPGRSQGMVRDTAQY